MNIGLVCLGILNCCYTGRYKQLSNLVVRRASHASESFTGGAGNFFQGKFSQNLPTIKATKIEDYLHLFWGSNPSSDNYFECFRMERGISFLLRFYHVDI
jgi:hypothetical protein